MPAIADNTTGRPPQPELRFQLNSGTTITDVEKTISRVGAMRDAERIDFDANGSVGRVPLLEAATATLLGTICRRAKWPIYINQRLSDEPKKKILGDLINLIGMFMSAECLSDSMRSVSVSREEILLEFIRETRSYRDRNFLHESQVQSRTICEFDPYFPLALPFGGNVIDLQDEERYGFVIETLKMMNKELQIYSNNNRFESKELKYLTNFIYELHENAWQYGRYSSATMPRAILPGIRYVRFQRFYYSKKENLQHALDQVPFVQSYFSNYTQKFPVNLFEINVSDFGVGILDFFLSSNAGEIQRKRDRRNFLEEIVLRDLTSSTMDPAAGQGIRNALTAVDLLGGVVLLRTDDSWVCYKPKSGSDDETNLILHDINVNLGRVEGTHWTMLYMREVE